MKRKILVVDDEMGIRLLLKDLFIQEGFHVATADTGLEVLKELEEQSFDLIILDYHLPVLDGASVIRRLKQNESTTPLIVMSGLPEKVAENIHTYDSVKKIVAKPFHIHEMVELAHLTLKQG